MSKTTVIIHTTADYIPTLKLYEKRGYSLSYHCILVMEKLIGSVDKNGKQEYSCYILSMVKNDESENY